MKAAEKNNEKTEAGSMSEKNDTLVQVEHLKKYFPIKGVKDRVYRLWKTSPLRLKEEKPLVW